MTDSTHWVGTWTAAPAPAEGAAFSNHTLRMNPRVSIGGRRLRVRISNAYGARPLVIGAAFVGLRGTGRRSCRGRTVVSPSAASPARRSPPARRSSATPWISSSGRWPTWRSACTCPGSARELRHHRAVRAADQLRLAARGLRGRGDDAGRTAHRRLVLRLRRRRGGAAGDRRHRGGGRLPDRRQHLDPRRPSQLALAARAPARRASGRAADGGDEPGPRRQPHPARHPRRQRAPALRPRRAGAARRHPRRHHARDQRPAEPPRPGGGRGDGAPDDRRASGSSRCAATRGASR